MHAHEQLLGQTLLPFEEAAQNQEVNAASEMNFGVVARRKDRLDRLHLHHFEVMIDRQQQTVIDGERLVAGHIP